jgi:hypothetical protein
MCFALNSVMISSFSMVGFAVAGLRII